MNEMLIDLDDEDDADVIDDGIASPIRSGPPSAALRPTTQQGPQPWPPAPARTSGGTGRGAEDDRRRSRRGVASWRRTPANTDATDSIAKQDDENANGPGLQGKEHRGRRDNDGRRFARRKEERGDARCFSRQVLAHGQVAG